MSDVAKRGCIDQDTTWYGGRPRPRRHCVKWRPSSPTERGTTTPHFSAHVYCGQTVAHLNILLFSNCYTFCRLAQLSHIDTHKSLFPRRPIPSFSDPTYSSGDICCAPFRGGGAGSPCNTMWPGLRPTSMPSGILIHPTVWPQRCIQTEQTTVP